MVIGYQMVIKVINGYLGLLMVISQLLMGLLMVISQLLMGLLMVTSQLSMVINGYWLSTSYQWFSMVQGLLMVSVSYQCLSRVINCCQSVINGNQWLSAINKLSMVIVSYQWL